MQTKSPKDTRTRRQSVSDKLVYKKYAVGIDSSDYSDQVLLVLLLPIHTHTLKHSLCRDAHP